MSSKLAARDVCLSEAAVEEAIALLRGAVMIVYPMGLPPHDNIRMELEGAEELEGTQASKEVVPPDAASLWFSGKEMQADKRLLDYVGRNDKTKVVVKLQRRGGGAPGREPVVSAEEQRQMMAYYYRKQEEMKVICVANEIGDLP